MKVTPILVTIAIASSLAQIVALPKAVLAQETIKWTQDDVNKNLDKVINNTSVSNYWMAGDHQTNTELVDAAVPGQVVKRVVVSESGAVWEAAAHSAFTRAISIGDLIVVAVWLRPEKLPEGDACQVNLRIEATEPPYSTPGEKQITITPDWQLYSFQAVADADYPAGKANIVIQYGNAKQVLLIGPVYVLNIGPSVAK